ncbi:MAG TPA: DNA methyltransferase [Steroidobacteraceae bacterium]|nr:DNA methyltransferase [Steroidobacteraceae bacterium]
MRDPQEAHNPKPYIGERTMLVQKVIQGDCKAVLRTLPNESVDFVLTDPPYLGRYKDRFGRTLANDDDPAAVVGAYAELYRVLENNRFCISFYGYPKLDAFVHAWTDAGFDTVGHIVWPKPYISSTRFVGVAHESAYVLAKGRPQKPARPLMDGSEVR